MGDVYGKGPALHALEAIDSVPGAFEVDMRQRAAAAIERVQTQVMLDEFRALPVGNRLAAKYWALRTTVSPIALEAHRRASVTLASAQAEARA